MSCPSHTQIPPSHPTSTQPPTDPIRFYLPAGHVQIHKQARGVSMAAKKNTKNPAATSGKGKINTKTGGKSSQSPQPAKPRKSASGAAAAVGKSAKPPRKLSNPELASLREKIDLIDRRLVKLLNERARLVVKVGEHKRASGVPIYAPHREQEVLSKVIGLSRDMGGPLPDKAIEAIYRELMSGSFHLEQPLRIGYLGPIGSYSHLAASRHFGSSVEYVDLHDIRGVFTEVARGHADYGLVPIENSLGGGIVDTLDAFRDHSGQVRVYAEAQLAVHHALLCNGSPSAVETIYSRPEVFQQCRGWIATQYPKAELVPVTSSARAVILAREAAEQAQREGKPDAGVAAIGSILAGEYYGVHAVFEDIEDDPNNITRFFVISKQATHASGDDKTSLMFVTEDKPGALAEVLNIFHRAGVNLTHIDKRPSRRENWTYTFFVDAEGHMEDPWFAAAVRQVEGVCRQMVILGSYPRSKRIL